MISRDDLRAKQSDPCANCGDGNRVRLVIFRDEQRAGTGDVHFLRVNTENRLPLARRVG